MLILPVNGLNLRYNSFSQVSFSGRNNRSDRESTSEKRSSNVLSKVPVAVLIGLTPAFIQSSNGRDSFINQEQKAMMVDSIVQTDTMDLEQVDTAARLKLHKYPFGLPQMKDYRMKDIRSFESDNREYYFVMAAYRASEENVSGIDKVFIFPKGIDGVRIYEVPYVNKLIHHDVGKESFYSAEILTSHKYDNSGKGDITYTDIRLPNDIGKAISNLLNDKSKYENRTLMQEETVNTEELQPKEVIAF